MAKILHKIYLWLTGYFLGLACKFIDESIYYNQHCNAQGTCSQCIYHNKDTDSIFPCRFSQLRESLFGADIHYELLKQYISNKNCL